MPKRISSSGQALRANELGIQLREKGEDDRALACYREALRLRPGWAAAWYNIGLVHKYRCEWVESLEANREAIRLDPSGEAAIWNVGIAATALGDWGRARSAWRQYGIDIGEGDGPVDYPIGATPVRVAVHGKPEVIWTHRIDPARAVIKSVPLAASGRRHGDLLLHDGAPNGYRKIGAREAAVFDELQVLHASAYSTFEAFVEGATDVDLDALQARSDAEAVTIENWSRTLHTLCKACSEGRPFAEGGHSHEAPADPGQPQRLGIAALDAGQALRALEAWLDSSPGATVSSFECVLDATAAPQAGSAA